MFQCIDVGFEVLLVHVEPERLKVAFGELIQLGLLFDLSREDRGDRLQEARPDRLPTVLRPDVGLSLPCQSLPKLRVLEQPNDLVGEGFRIVGDQDVLAIPQIQPLHADASGYAGRADHEGLDQLPLGARSV